MVETWIFAFLNATWGLAVLICTKVDKSLSFSCKFLVLSGNARCGAVVAQDYAGKYVSMWPNELRSACLGA